MKKPVIILLGATFLAAGAFAGFKVKLVKPKKPEQFQTRVTVDKTTYAADLLIQGKEQDDFFYRELTPSNVIAVRLAVFNDGREAVSLDLDGLQLEDPGGNPVPRIDPDTVSEAVLKGLVVAPKDARKNPAVVATPTMRNPRDPNDPRYDPRRDPTDPNYDPTDPRNRRYGTSPYGVPGVDIVLNPGGGTGGGDLSEIEKTLVQKDFRDKMHTSEPVLPSMKRDKFLYFLIEEPPAGPKGFKLHLPPGKGMSKEVVLVF